jgi:hypothetical protein
MQGYGNDPGIYQRTFDELFKVMHDRSETVRIELRASITEIYNEEVRDLLVTEKKARLQIKTSKEEGVHVPGLTKQVVNRAEDVEALLAQGQKKSFCGLHRYEFTLFSLSSSGSNLWDHDDTSRQANALLYHFGRLGWQRKVGEVWCDRRQSQRSYQYQQKP